MACYSKTPRQRIVLTALPRNGGAMNSVSRLSSPSAGYARSTASQTAGGRRPRPSTQMLRYLRRVDDLTTGALRWGVLTNGARWRLYYQGARSVSEQFFELDLAALLDLPGHNEGLFALTAHQRRYWLTVFALVFRRAAFVAGPTDPRTFHQRAIEDARFYEERVAANLSELVFGQVFPGLARAIAAAAPEAPLPDVREAVLVLLYRLLFILYAEDRDLLPVRDTRYDDYALRKNVRGDIGQRKDQEDVFSARATRYWSALDDSVSGHCSRRCVHRLTALQRRTIRPVPYAAPRADPIGRCGHGHRHRCAVV